jgi:hypothetical protein
MEITIDPTQLATIGTITGAIVQYVKSLPFFKTHSDTLPLLSIVVGALVGFGASQVLGWNVGWVQGIMAGMLASGGFDLIKGGIGIVKR